MKNTTINKVKKGALVFVLIGTIGLMYACKDSFLEIPVTGELDKSVLGNKAGVNAALIAAYSQINGRGAIAIAIDFACFVGKVGLRFGMGIIASIDDR